MNILDKIVLEKKNHLKYLNQKLNKKNTIYIKPNSLKYILNQIV